MSNYSYFQVNRPRSRGASPCAPTTVYTDDSSICNAAVHAGLITTRNGGQVRIRICPGAVSYYGTTRNGVNSRNYGSWGGSFIFVR
ncbi:LCCL domain-containing protein [Nostoc sp.]|uniref:LCCL domain-containing protein n=1 Tax=Nostoc sp. TaxID=1180 RepID=UPI003FA5655E